MLASNIDNVMELIESTYKQSEKISDNDHIEKLFNILQSSENTLIQPASSLNSLGCYINDLCLDEVKNKISYLIAIINSLLADADSISNINRQSLIELVNLSRQVDESIKNSWQQYMITKNKELIDSLNLIEKLVENKIKVLQLRHSIKNISQSWPVKKTDIDKYDNAVNESKNLIKELDVNKNIQSFLLLAINQEATLEDIDDDILEWLKKQKVLSKMKIVYSE